MIDRIVVEVEHASGPGIDFDRDQHGGVIGRRARHGGVWLGFDRAALVDSDDGSGRRLPVLVALPTSTYPGCRLEVELAGGWQTEHGFILVGRVAGTPLPAPVLGRVAAGLEDGQWFDIDAAGGIARTSRQRYRERQSHARILGGRAWDAVGVLPPELARLATPHSAAEYSLARLPPRFVRALEGLLDDAERLLYWIERPAITEPTLIERLGRQTDRRSALLALSDRELLWIVDHARPDRYLSDWGVDVEIVPLERLLDVHRSTRAGLIELTVVTPAGPRAYSLPAEFESEVEVMNDLIARFTPAAGWIPRRRYPIDALPFDLAGPARFKQEREALALYDAAQRTGDVLGFMFSPRRPGQRSAAALVVRTAAVELIGRELRQAIPLDQVAALAVTLSPLSGRIATHPGIGLTFPAPMMDRGAAFVRLTRRALAGVG